MAQWAALSWTDAFGVVLLVSLYAELGEQRFLDEAEWLVAEVERVLGRPRGIRIGEAPDRDGQYFHYLAMWLYALSVLARHVPAYRAQGRRSCTPDPRRLCGAGEGRNLEDERRFERALSAALVSARSMHSMGMSPIGASMSRPWRAKSPICGR